MGLRKQPPKTKIIATIGPQGREILDPSGVYREVDYDQLLPLVVQEGVDIFRLNMAFFLDGKNERKIFRWLRNNRNGLSRSLAVEGDLPGPKLRLGDFGGKAYRLYGTKQFDLHFGKKITGDQSRASVLLYDKPFRKMGEYVKEALESSKEVFIDIGDGKIVLKATRNSLNTPGVINCVVEAIEKEGEIIRGQGVTLKNVEIDLPSFGKKDREALDFLLEEGSDFLAFVGVSFVKNAEDILEVKYYVENYFFRKLKSRKPKAKDKALWAEARLCAPAIVAKIETKQGAGSENIDEIIDVADAIMVARGDLGLQLNPEDVPSRAKRIIRKCNLRGKPVITATQMLDSMERNMWPTRAEVTDVFNAILDGTDAVMLSGETSKGRYPIQSVRMMVKIVQKAEKYLKGKDSNTECFEAVIAGSKSQLERNNERFRTKIAEAGAKSRNFRLSKKRGKYYEWVRDLYSEKLEKSQKQETTDHISEAACILAGEQEYEAIITATTSGRTARMVSRFRPNARIVGAAHDIMNARKLTICFGVIAINVGKISTKTRRRFRTSEEIFEQAISLAKIAQYVKKDSKVVLVVGIPLFTPGATNSIRIKEVT